MKHTLVLSGYQIDGGQLTVLKIFEKKGIWIQCFIQYLIRYLADRTLIAFSDKLPGIKM